MKEAGSVVIPTTARPPAFEDLPPFDLGGQPTTTAVEQLGDSTLDSLDRLLPGSSTSGTSDVLPAIGGDLGGAGSIDELGGGREPPSDSDTSQLPPEGRRDQLDPQEGDPSQPASEVVTTSTLIGPDSQITDNSGPIEDQMTTVVSKDPKITSADPIRGEITTAVPIRGEMTTADSIRGEITDPIRGKITTADLIRGKITTADPIRGEITTAVPIRGEMTTADSIRGEITDPIRGKITTAETIRGEITTADPIRGVTTIADPIRGEITTADPIIAEMTTAEASRGADTDIIGSLEPGRNLPAIESSGGGLQGAAQNSTEEEKGGEEEGDVMGTTVGGGEEEEKVDILGRESV